MSTALYRGGPVYAAHRPDATAVLVDQGTIGWVGLSEAAPGADTVVELDGAVVTPAFVDAHVHSTSTGLSLDGLNLAGAPSLAAALDALERFARARSGGIVLGTGWDETRWPERRSPTASELDRASYGGVVYLARADVHSAVASSALLAAVPEVRNLPGFRDDGFVTLQAHHVLRRVANESIPAGARRDAQRTTRRRAAELGIACLHELAGPDISGERDLTALLELSRLEAGPEVVGYWASLSDVDVPRRLGLRGGAGDLFVDGAIGSRTAALREPYADASTNGDLRYEADEIAGHVLACIGADLQAGFHVIGDRAVDAVLAGFAIAADQVGLDRVRAGRHRVEHVEMLSDVAALARFGVTASVQPAFDAAWGGPDGMYAERLGLDRARPMNPFAAMAAAGVPLAFGSDSPVTPLDPWGGVRAAVLHQTEESRLPVDIAFAAHTRGGWYAAGKDDAGELRPGAPASFAVWAAGSSGAGGPLPDLTAPTPQCLRTVVRGTTVYTRPGALE
ncbi:MAG: amidohydrolase [Mycobacteriales bacterium]